jgi:hypothetical protein
MPMTPLDRHAIGVIFNASVIMYYATESAFLSITYNVASGVTSLTANPVPPDVNIISQSSILCIALTIASISSATIS